MRKARSLRHGVVRACACLLGLVGAIEPAAALNVPVASRMSAFLQPPLTKTVTAAIVYDPESASSEAEASAIEDEFGDGIAIGRGMVRVRSVPIGSLASLPGVRRAFVTDGIRDQRQLAGFASRDGVLTITSDTGCVQAARCVLAVSDGARTQITVSKAAAKANHVHFASAFLMLVRKR